MCEMKHWSFRIFLPFWAHWVFQSLCCQVILCQMIHNGKWIIAQRRIVFISCTPLKRYDLWQSSSSCEPTALYCAHRNIILQPPQRKLLLKVCCFGDVMEFSFVFTYVKYVIFFWEVSPKIFLEISLYWGLMLIWCDEFGTKNTFCRRGSYRKRVLNLFALIFECSISTSTIRVVHCKNVTKMHTYQTVVPKKDCLMHLMILSQAPLVQRVSMWM